MKIPGYTLIKKINSGGMATVYVATQHSVGRTLALKVMKSALDVDPEFHQRFKLEATIIGQLSHPNIIPIYDIGRHEGYNYISMEFLPKGSLDQKIAAGISSEIVVKIMIHIAAALEHAHNKGYVHRDIKPENILFRADDSPVLTDFGIARTIKSNTHMTQIGMVIGTPLYMSPEQAKGEASDGRSDLYSLGVVFYEMLTGQRPFQADSSLALGIKHIHEQPPKLPLQFFIMQPVLDKLLAKKPAQRYQHARELINDLEQLAASAPLRVSANGNIKILPLLHTMAFLIAQDFWFYAKKIGYLLSQLARRILHKPENNLVLHNATPELKEAHTLISARPIAVDIFNHYRHKRLWVYSSAIGLLMVALISINFIDSGAAQTKTASATLATKKMERLELKIDTTPAGARIRVLNIKENYHPGMTVTPGTYHIEASLDGYNTQTEWVELQSNNQFINVSLRQKENNPNTLPLPEMVFINAGEFLMGNANSTRKNSVKKVFIDASFYIGRYEITFNEYDYFALATNRALPEDNGWGRGNQPAINISWDDAVAYTNWLSKITGKHYRLAEAIEWEYAARGNTSSTYWWGNNAKDAVDRANCSFGCQPLLSGFGLFNSQTQPVGHYPPNDFGLYDTAGNVAEWVNDCSEKQPGKTTLACEHRLTRGGSYADSATDISVFSAVETRPTETQKTIGFRIVRAEERRPLKNLLKQIFSYR